MRLLSGSNRRAFSPVKSVRFAVATAFALSPTFVYADETTPASVPAQSSEPSTASISREVKEIFEKSGKAVVTMFHIQGMPHAEISKILKVSEGTVRSRLFYANRQLQNYLDEFRKNPVS